MIEADLRASLTQLSEVDMICNFVNDSTSIEIKMKLIIKQKVSDRARKKKAGRFGSRDDVPE